MHVMSTYNGHAKRVKRYVERPHMVLLVAFMCVCVGLSVCSCQGKTEVEGMTL